MKIDTRKAFSPNILQVIYFMLCNKNYMVSTAITDEIKQYNDKFIDIFKKEYKIDNFNDFINNIPKSSDENIINLDNENINDDLEFELIDFVNSPNPSKEEINKIFSNFKTNYYYGLYFLILINNTYSIVEDLIIQLPSASDIMRNINPENKERRHFFKYNLILIQKIGLIASIFVIIITFSLIYNFLNPVKNMGVNDIEFFLERKNDGKIMKTGEHISKEEQFYISLKFSRKNKLNSGILFGLTENEPYIYEIFDKEYIKRISNEKEQYIEKNGENRIFQFKNTQNYIFISLIFFENNGIRSDIIENTKSFLKINPKPSVELINEFLKNNNCYGEGLYLEVR